MRILQDGQLAYALAVEPRLTESQRDALRKTGREDPYAECVGLDAKMRPVIQAKMPGPRRQTRWALMGNGRPAKVVPDGRGRLAERW